MSVRNRAAVFALLLASGLPLLAGGCTKRNPAVCCTTEADCDALGLPPGSGCAEGVCVGNQCVDQSCQAESDCPSGAPFCSTSGSCVQCLDSSHCGALECDPVSNGCVECLNVSDCTDGKVCDLASHTCAACQDPAQCPSGLCDLGSGRCIGAARITPKFTPLACDSVGTGPLTLSATTELSSDDPAVCNGGFVGQQTGPQICVVRHTTIAVEQGATITFVGTRAVALVADGDVTISGTVDVSAALRIDGPGGGQATDGVASGPIGGGGAGFRTPGGSGGDASSLGGAANSGPSRPSPVDTGILAGGPRTESAGGGGAVSIVSCRGTVRLSGLVSTVGAGGAAGRNRATTLGAGGGGAGGYVILQGVDVEVSGRLFANGGAGGSGRPVNSDKGASGQNGSLSSAVGALGPTGTAGAGSGGSGGYAGAGPKPGGMLLAAGATAGGGGGSTGFLQTATAGGHAPMLMPLDVSPVVEPNVTLATH